MLAGVGRNEKHRKYGPPLWLVCGLAVWVAAFAVAGASGFAGNRPEGSGKKSAVAQNPPKAAAKQVTPPAVTPGAVYVGEDTCVTCHDAQKKGYAESLHHRAADPRTPAAAQSCETCHGPGSKHVGDPANNKLRQFSKMSSDEVNAVCTTCHTKGPHTMWAGSTHEQRGLSCTTCHSVHDAKSEKAQLKQATQMQLCGTCHRDKIAKLEKTGHMPVREGKMECSSCHNPHGSTNVKMLKAGDSITESCTSCHSEKRGPYLFEHAPVRDGCTTCHDAHGSSNERMLQAKLPMLCQRCHVSSRHPPTIYDMTQLLNNSNRLLSRACVNCHPAIHGSNHPAGQFFMR
jgi:DmsE family decaheme c-type cytochrome